MAHVCRVGRTFAKHRLYSSTGTMNAQTALDQVRERKPGNHGDEMLEPVKLVTALLSRDLEASAEGGAGGADRTQDLSL